METDCATTSTAGSLVLTGLDGSNPLAFLAALGVLHLLSRRRSAGETSPLLAWTWRGGAPRPLIIASAAADRSTLVQTLLAEMKSDFGSGEHPAFLYNDIIAIEPAQFRSRLVAALDDTSGASGHILDLLSGFGSDACLQTQGKQRGLIEPSPLSFANRQSNRFLLDDYAALVVGSTTQSSSYPALDEAKLSEALFEPWKYSDRHKELRWDPSELRLAALPAGAGGTVQGANALAFWALAVLTSVPSRNGLRALGVRVVKGARGRIGTFLLMPIWEHPINLETVRSLLGYEGLHAAELDAQSLRARGIVQLFVSRVIAYQKANYFAPSVAV